MTTTSDSPAAANTVALVTLGCARNDVDSEELAARLEAGGFALVDDADEADTVVVNTCGFVDSAKKDSIDTLLAASDYKDGGRTKAVVAVGCLAERYGEQLAAELPEADAVLGFDDYAGIADRLRSILDGTPHTSHAPRDRRKLLPLAPTARPEAGAAVAVPGHATQAVGSEEASAMAHGSSDAAVVEEPDLAAAPASGPRVVRRRLDGGPVAPLKLASGCDRRCAFCAIPSFRGAFLSRRPTDVLGEARWLAGNGVREVFLVSENSTSYGKDLGDLRLLETLLPELAAIDGLDRVRVSYLQPAEMRPTLITAMATTPGVVPYFDLSFQHASGPLLRRMRRFGDAESFLELIGRVRAEAPRAGIRSNVIVGFPGETDDDVEVLADFLGRAGLDAVGVFGYSDEDGTEAATYDGKLDPDTIAARVDRISRLAEEVTADRAHDRIGETVDVLLESFDPDGGSEPAERTAERRTAEGRTAEGRTAEGRTAEGRAAEGRAAEGRAAHQGPEVDGSTMVHGLPPSAKAGEIVAAVVVDSVGVDLVAEVRAEPTTPGVSADSLTA